MDKLLASLLRGFTYEIDAAPAYGGMSYTITAERDTYSICRVLYKALQLNPNHLEKWHQESKWEIYNGEWEVKHISGSAVTHKIVLADGYVFFRILPKVYIGVSFIRVKVTQTAYDHMKKRMHQPKQGYDLYVTDNADIFFG